MPPSAEAPPASYRLVCDSEPTSALVPRAQCVSIAARLPIVPLVTSSAASLPIIVAAIASSRFTVGSSPYTSSPSSARAMASRISGAGRLTVSLRRSIKGAAFPETQSIVQRKQRGEVPVRRVGNLDRVFGGIRIVQSVSVGRDGASRTDMSIYQGERAHLVGGGIDLPNRVIVAIHEVKRGPAQAHRAWIGKGRLVAGAVVDPFFAGARDGLGFQRRKIDFTNHVVAGVGDVDEFAVGRDTVRPIEGRFGRGAVIFAGLLRLPADRLDDVFGEAQAANGAVTAVGNEQRGAVACYLGWQVEVGGRGRAILSSRDIRRAGRRRHRPGVEVYLAQVGIVGVEHIERAAHQDHPVGAVETRRLSDAVVAAFLKRLTGDNRDT